MRFKPISVNCRLDQREGNAIDYVNPRDLRVWPDDGGNFRIVERYGGCGADSCYETMVSGIPFKEEAEQLVSEAGSRL